MQDDDIDDIFDFLNDKDVFRSFGQALEAFVVKRMPGSFGKTPREYVQKCLNDKKIHMNVNTLKNWFSGTRPKKGKQTRENLYLIAFALELNADDTAELFQKVYYDKAFDMRDRAEFIYFYCLSNRLDYQTACRMLSIVEESDTTITPEESTIFTGNIVLDAEQLQEEMQVISYIKKHPYNFRIHNKQAKKELNRLIDRIRISNDDKEALQKYRQKVSAEENKKRRYPRPKVAKTLNTDQYMELHAVQPDTDENQQKDVSQSQKEAQQKKRPPKNADRSSDEPEAGEGERPRHFRNENRRGRGHRGRPEGEAKAEEKPEEPEKV